MSMSATAKPVMSANGRIEWLLMVCSEDVGAAFFQIVLELLQKMPPHTRFILYCTSVEKRLALKTFFNTRDFSDFCEDFPLAGHAPKCLLLAPPVNEYRSYPKWARDAFFVKWAPDIQIASLQETKRTRENDSYLAEALEGLDIGALNIHPGPDFPDLILAGGNALLVEHYVLAGFEEVKQNLDEETSEETIVLQLKNLFNTSADEPFREIILAGRTATSKIQVFINAVLAYFSPATRAEIEIRTKFTRSMLSHLDMFLTVTGVSTEQGKPVLFLAQRCRIYVRQYQRTGKKHSDNP